jgi:hypothetical protein
VRKNRKMSSVSAVPSLIAVAYLTIWSYCCAISSQLIVLDRIGASCSFDRYVA